MKLFKEAIGKFLAGVILVGLLIFLPAGSLGYKQGWLLMGLLFVPMFAAGLVMMAKNPNLLRSRLDAKETEKEQDKVVKLSGLLFLLSFISAGLSYRHHFLMLPMGVSVFFGLVFLLAYALYAEVLRENTWLSRTIGVQEGQTVVDTGLYGVVRHPMYFVTVMLFWVMPLTLGSVVAFVFLLPYPLLLKRRILNEEEVLCRDLPGYDAYMQKVKYRLIPFIW